MRKSSSNSSRDSGSDSSGSFRSSEGSQGGSSDKKPYKKNYDGRSPASGEGRPQKSRPYSGRVAEGDAPKRPFEKPAYGKGPAKDGAERKPRREFDKPGRDGDRKPFSDRPKKSYDKPAKDTGDRVPFGERPKRTFNRPADGEGDSKSGTSRKPRKEFDKPGRDSDRKPFSDRPKRTFDKPSFKKDEGRDAGARPPRKEFDKPGRDGKPFSDRPKKSFDKPAFGKGGFKDNAERRPRKEFDKRGKDETKPFDDLLNNAFNNPKKEKPEREIIPDQVFEMPEKHVPGDSRPFRNRPESAYNKQKQEAEGDIGDGEEIHEERKPSKHSEKQPFEDSPKTRERNGKGRKKHFHDHSEGRGKHDEDDEELDEEDKEISQKGGPRLEMPLNKFIAHCGECSRRDAAELVKQGKVKVNGELVLDPGYRVQHDDKVTKSGKKLTPQKGMVYILLNKPKGFITTNEDPQGRKTVMELVGNSGVDRLFPVGRLDRDTSGLLLITNDGDLTQKLCHPSYNIKKVYHVTLDKALTKADFEKIIEGVDLEDGIAKVDALAYLEKKNELGLEIHSGRNRIVRRIFESLAYEVVKLDRVMYAGLTKKNLPRSKWRYLDEREVVLLKHFKI